MQTPSPKEITRLLFAWGDGDQSALEQLTPLVVRLKPFTRGRSFGSLDTMRWSSDGSALTYIDTRAGVSNIWSQPLSGGKPVQLTNFTTGRIFNFAWSRDGKWLVLARGSMTNDVVLISDLR